MPQISVIVPVYKVEAYLHRCVDSILAQTFRDFELILVDDGSPDRCGEICDDYKKHDVRIHVIHQANGGLSAARNAGIDWALANSDSTWLAFVDSDDWVHPQYLECLYRAVRENNVKISICEYAETEEKTAFDKPLYEPQIWAWDQFFMERNVSAVVAWNKLYAKELFIGLRYPVGKIHEDEFLTYKLLIRAERIIYLSDTLYYYYQNSQGITKSQFNLKRLDAIEALEARLDFISEKQNKAVKKYCVNSFLYAGIHYALKLRKAEYIPSGIRMQAEKDIQRKVRRVLIRYGFRYAPPWKKLWYYDFAFPTLTNIARQSVRFFRKLKGTKENHGDN